MRDLFHNLLRWKLDRLARLTLWRFRPGIVGVTGSVGKTSSKLAIAAVLGIERRVRASPANLNNELGLPLAIVGNWRDRDVQVVSRGSASGCIKKSFFWIRVLLGGIAQLLFLPQRRYPEILVLEYGADKPGDIKTLVSIARPHVGVITAVGDVPVHVEFYANQAEVAREKSRLIEPLPAAGFAVLNFDDPTVMELQGWTRAHVATYGFKKGAEVELTHFKHRVENGKPEGISFKIAQGSSVVPVRLDGSFGRTHAYAAGAAAAVGIAFGMNLVAISEALKKYIPAPGRMELHEGVRETHILDDSYNASPLSMRAALETLRDLPLQRKIAVLGDMLEIGTYAMEAHESIGRFAAECADVLVAVGPRARFIADAAIRAGLDRKSVLRFDEARKAMKPLHDLLHPGDLVLVKGSHAMHLEQIVESITLH